MILLRNAPCDMNFLFDMPWAGGYLEAIFLEKRKILNNRTGMIEAIGVREHIRCLEGVKDDIVAFHESAARPDDALRRIWIADVRELYGVVLAAAELLPSIAGGSDENAGACVQFLGAAESLNRQVLSELKGVRSKASRRLQRRLAEAFESCHDRIAETVRPFVRANDGQPPVATVSRAGDTEFHLHCAVCGEVSFVFRIGVPRFSTEECLVYEGITHAGGVDRKHARRIFTLLDAGAVGRAHSYLMRKKLLEDGIDAYCPECDAVYCREHYHANEEWDDGFYDCTTGTCPRGHHRIIDD